MKLTIIIAIYVACIGYSKGECLFNGFFPCPSGKCIQNDLVCDGIPDCYDASDETEELCWLRPCRSGLSPLLDLFDLSDNEYIGDGRCDYGACINRIQLCNGFVDCADGSDESENRCNKNRRCTREEFRCTYGACIKNFVLCNGYPDCLDGSDEEDHCQYRLCQRNEFRCRYGACIWKDKVCDGNINCIDGSDESDDVCGPRSGIAIKRMHVSQYFRSNSTSTIIPSTSPILDKGSTTLHNHSSHTTKLSQDHSMMMDPRNKSTTVKDAVDIADGGYVQHDLTNLNQGSVNPAELDMPANVDDAADGSSGTHLSTTFSTTKENQTTVQDFMHFMSVDHQSEDNISSTTKETITNDLPDVKVDFDKITLFEGGKIEKDAKFFNNSPSPTHIHYHDSSCCMDFDGSDIVVDILKCGESFSIVSCEDKIVPSGTEIIARCWDSKPMVLSCGDGLWHSSIPEVGTLANICQFRRINSPVCGRIPLPKQSLRMTADNRNRNYIHPWIVGLKINGLYACTGTVISSNWIMATSGCLKRNSGNLASIQVEHYDSDGNLALSNVSAVHFYPNKNGGHDINSLAVIKINTLMLSKDVIPACIQLSKIDDGDLALAYSRPSSEQTHKWSLFTQQLKLNCSSLIHKECLNDEETSSQDVCGIHTANINNVKESGLGSPAVVNRLLEHIEKWTVVGITRKNGLQCRRPVTIYTMVKVFSQWIKDCIDYDLCE